MNKRPVSYLQTDKRWKNVPYAVKGKENGTIGTSGCGPTSAAMLLATLIDPKITPVECAQWSMEHGYKYVNQGTAWAYFIPQFAAYGIRCLKAGRDHEKVKRALSEGWYAIALMGPGTWTKGGHYIVVWDWDSKVRVNDSASTRDKRLNGDPATFKKEVKQYWIIDASAYNKGDEDMDQERFNRMFAEAMKQYRSELRDNDCGGWSEAARQFVVEQGIFAGGGPDPDGQPNYMWEDLLTREQAAQLLYAFARKFNLA